jgi:hypothetical protein
MRAITTTLLLASFVHAHSQVAQSLVLVPRWKVGDSRNVRISEVRNELTNGAASAKHQDLDLSMRLVNDDARHFIVRVDMDNPLLLAAHGMSSVLGDELKAWERLTLRYAFSRTDGSAHLENGAEAKKFLDQSYQETLKFFTALHPKAGQEFKDLAAPMIEQFNDSVSVAMYFAGTIGCTTFPYGRKLVLGDTLRFVSYGPNPFGGGPDSARMETRAVLKQMDQEARSCVIDVERILDEKALLEDMRQLMSTTLPAVPAERKQAEAEISAKLKGLHFDMSQHSTYVVDLNTTWPVQLSIASHTVATSQGKTKEATVTTSMVFAK